MKIPLTNRLEVQLRPLIVQYILDINSLLSFFLSLRSTSPKEATNNNNNEKKTSLPTEGSLPTSSGKIAPQIFSLSLSWLPFNSIRNSMSFSFKRMTATVSRVVWNGVNCCAINPTVSRPPPSPPVMGTMNIGWDLRCNSAAARRQYPPWCLLACYSTWDMRIRVKITTALVSSLLSDNGEKVQLLFETIDARLSCQRARLVWNKTQPVVVVSLFLLPFTSFHFLFHVEKSGSR